MIGERQQVQEIQPASPVLEQGWQDNNQRSAPDLTLILKLILKDTIIYVYPYLLHFKDK